LQYFRPSGLILRGWVMAQEGASEAGLALMRHSAAERLALGMGWYQIRYLCMLAETHLQAGAAEEGLSVIAQATDLVTQDNEHTWKAELRRLEGELWSAQGAFSGRRRVLFGAGVGNGPGTERQVIRAAGRDQSRPTPARPGKHSEACALLAPVYGWFTEGFDTRDLKKAKALLDELS
jgi:predicted ATPase